ncbi:MAG TPA: type II toxin-antitoxin system RelE/ParE family toxin [Candidatus Methylomirabilis sp.]|nr:type II toxin-antitoxin system RelE/ParE family toxin [Candidatus Methylomirabilis sp.]
MRVEILDEARQDLVDGYRYYESQAAGLGDYFLDSLIADIDSLRFYAGIHNLHLGYNRLLCKRFPFAVYYHVESAIARVYAVLDCRRDPSWIRNRLT